MNVGPRVVAVLLPGGAVCRHECWPHPGVGSSRQCLRGRGGQSGGFTSGTVRGDLARSPQRGPVDSGAGRTPQGPPAGGGGGGRVRVTPATYGVPGGGKADASACRTAR